MAELKSPLEILKLLDKSNCKKCGMPTCLAFAAAVFKGQKLLNECPRLDEETLRKYSGEVARPDSIEQNRAEFMEQLKKEVASIDLAAAAQRLGEPFSNGTLTIQCLGKDFRIDTKGNISTEIHVNPWIAIPVFNYVLYGAGIPVSGKWVPLRELEGGKTWYRLFGQRCEKPLKKVADTYTDLFEDMIRLFHGTQVENHYASDISLVLHPLPKLPILICYWKPDDGLESDLNIFFDSTAEKNLNIDSIYMLAAGLVVMFEKLALKHGAGID